MELRILRYFLAVAEEGSFSRAAERLHVSQPALSQQLAQLEREIDDQLFIRAARRLELTDKAVMLMRRARELATAYNAQVHLVNAVRPVLNPYPGDLVGLSPEILGERIRREWPPRPNVPSI